MNKFYTKKVCVCACVVVGSVSLTRAQTGAGERVVKLPLATLSTLITIHRNLALPTEGDDDAEALQQKLDRCAVQRKKRRSSHPLPAQLPASGYSDSRGQSRRGSHVGRAQNAPLQSLCGRRRHL